jgi:hypothetical protein
LKQEIENLKKTITLKSIYGKDRFSIEYNQAMFNKLISQNKQRRYKEYLPISSYR